MRGLAEFGNETVTFGQINGILSLLSLLGARFSFSSFTLLSDLETTSAKMFQKIASEYFLGMNHQNSVDAGNWKASNNTGYILLEKSEADISKVINSKAKLIIAIFKVKKNSSAPLWFLEKLVIPPSVLFFAILLPENSESVHSGNTSEEITAKCFRLYKPTSTVPLRMFLLLYYDEQSRKWFWATEETDWDFYEKATRNMKGITITIALATPLDEKLSIDRFWESKNSFFWRAMSEHLQFRPVIHFHKIQTHLLKNTTSIYLSLLTTVADGLAVLPVISSDRDNQVEFILTGCDSKYHLMVKTPEYVHSWQSILKPLTLNSWICTAMAVLLISVVLRIVSHEPNLLSLSSCCLTTFGFICSQGCPNISRNCSTRIVCYTALIFSMLMYQFYTSNFYSLLSTKKPRLPFTSLEQFLARRTHNMYINPDTAIYGQIMKAKSGPLKRLWDDFLRKDPSHRLKTHSRLKALSNVCRGKSAIFGLPFQTIYFRELQCKLVPVNSGYYPTNVVTVVRKNFPFKPQFKFVHLRLLEAGISHKFRDEFLNFEPQHKNMESVTNEPVSLEHVVFLLGFLGAFSVVSLLVLVLEMLTARSIQTRK